MGMPRKQWESALQEWLTRRVVVPGDAYMPGALAQYGPVVPLERFKHDLNARIALAIEEGDTDSAKAIVSYFHWAITAGATVDPRVLEYVKRAGERYAADPRKDIRKALGLVKNRRGNPGRIASGKRRLSPGAFAEMGGAVLKMIEGGKPEHEAVELASSEYQVTERTVRTALSEARQQKADLDSALAHPYRRQPRSSPE